MGVCKTTFYFVCVCVLGELLWDTDETLAHLEKVLEMYRNGHYLLNVTQRHKTSKCTHTHTYIHKRLSYYSKLFFYRFYTLPDINRTKKSTGFSELYRFDLYYLDEMKHWFLFIQFSGVQKHHIIQAVCYSFLWISCALLSSLPLVQKSLFQVA